MQINWRAVLGIVLSAGFLWWALHDVDPGEVLERIRRANIGLLALSVVLATAIFPLRALRWRVILEPVIHHPPLGPLWRATTIGMMVNNVVPARVGEIARAYALTREVPRLPFSASFASLVVDRVFDAVIVMLLLVVALLDPALADTSPEVSSRLTHTLSLGTVFAAMLLGALYALVFFPAVMLRWFEALTRRVAPRFEERGRAMLQAFAQGLSVLRSPGRFVAVFLWTLAHWMLNAFAFWVAFRAFGIEVSYFAALLVQSVIVVGVAIPQAPGFFGVFEAAAKWTLVSVYAVSADAAITWAIGFHILSFIPITLIGAYYFVRLGLHVGELKQQAGDGGEPPAARATS